MRVFQGIDSIPQLFDLAHRQVVALLTGRDLAQLHQVPSGQVSSLGWLEPTICTDIFEHCRTLAARERAHRYRLRKAQRRRILEILGEASLEDGRRMFVLASAIDQSFSGFAHDYEDPLGLPALHGCAPTPARFLDDIANPPPMIGQMTPVALCRRWFRNFWAAGEPGELLCFGHFPSCERCALPEPTRLALQGAIDDESLRLALVTWRRHLPTDLQLATSPGRFAVPGLLTTASPTLISRLLEHLARERIHLALLPELALSEAELGDLKGQLRARHRRLPALLIAGLVHRPSNDGNSHVNEALVLDADGKELFRHEKLEPITHKDLGREDILPRQSERYHYLDTPVGRLVVNVCRDFRSDVPMVLNRALGATLLAVPAYSQALDFVMEEARVLGARQCAITVAANPANEELTDAAVAYAPIRGMECCSKSVSQAGLMTPAGNEELAVLTITVGRRSRADAYLAASNLARL
jgi:hypothetical protein